jgi:hypothetical protein
MGLSVLPILVSSVAIGFQSSHGWERRVDDRTRLPAPLVKALAAAEIKVPR